MLDLDWNEWFAAFLFGIALDADHLFAAPRYISSNGWGAIMRPSWDDGSGLVWRSLLHEPVGAFVVAPLSIGWRFLLPLLFWSLHVGIDGFQNATLAYNTPIEATVFTGTVAAIFYVMYRRWSQLQPEGANLRAYANHIGTSLIAYISPRSG